MDIDKLFKLPSVSQSSVNKRKWAEPSSSALKAARVEDVEEGEGEATGGFGGSASRVNGRGKGRSAGVVDGGDGDDEDEAYGPSASAGGAYDDDGEFAPGNDADYFVDEDDEGGRFFGGGLTSQQKRILELMNRAGRTTEGAAGDGARDEDDEGQSPEEELKSLRRCILRLERAINKNQELRVKYGDDPQKFINSEADLHDSIRALVVVTTNPALLYPELVKQGTAASLCGLLTHENIDISASAIELFEEMTDDDVLDAGLEFRTEEQLQDEGTRKGQIAVDSVLAALLENSLIDLLIQTLPRLESSDRKEEEPDSAVAQANAESDAAAIFHILSLVENLVSLRAGLAERFIEDKTFRGWLFSRLSHKSKLDQNKGYVAELLAILLQAGTADESRARCVRLGQLDGIDVLLQALSPLRKRVPHEGEEREYSENLFDAMCALLTAPQNKALFCDAEGTELMCLVMKNKGYIRVCALKVMNHAVSGPQGAGNCIRFIESQGLKYLFSVLMRGSGGGRDADLTPQEEAHLLELIGSLLNNLASGSMERIRLVSKFVEGEYEKLDRLVEMRFAAHTRVRNIEKVIAQEQRAASPPLDDAEQEEREMDAYLRRLDSGLFALQLADYILAWLIMEDDGIQAHVRLLLGRRADEGDEGQNGTQDVKSPFSDIIATLQEYHSNIGDDVIVAEPDIDDESGLRLRVVLVQLVNYLLGTL